MYIVHNDTIGRHFRDLLIARARDGVRVRVLYDWFGCLKPSMFRFWRELERAGGEVRVANPPAFNSLLAIGSRDHRKLLVVDGDVAFVSGLCIGKAWIGDAAKGIAPWRDTGIEFRGPAVADAEAAFASAWRLWGPPIPDHEWPARRDEPHVGPVTLSVIPTDPEKTRLYRLELLISTLARERLWLTDAYFMPTSTYLEALSTAARNGVDVRLLVPGSSDVGWVANLSRTLYRRLIESGVRVFEWNGSMIHSKTAVVDGQLSRIGSTNLNLASWIGNWELDAVIPDEGIARQMEEQFARDLAESTEIVLTERRRVRLDLPAGQRPVKHRRQRRGSAGWMVADLGFVRSTLGAAVRGHRVLGAAESSPLIFFGTIFLAAATLFSFFPEVVAYPLAVILVMEGLMLLWKGLRLKRAARPAPAAHRDPAVPARSDRGISP
jgi:phosphatidylserine/phosphatidylglycerophosphate/cardiolipin synthase-like enzyme